MKILAINSWSNTDLSKHSPIDFWRIQSPLEELKKHVDWQIDYQPVFLPGADEFTSPDDFDEAALDHAAEQLGSYDIIISSYQPSPFVFSLLQIVNKRYGTKYILDDDDDVYNIEPDSLYWKTASREDAAAMQRMIELNDYVTTTTKSLQQTYEAHKASKGKGKVFLLPNYISDAYKNDQPKDGQRINIGYFGGAGHYHDLHETGVLPALEKLMHEHKDVHFTTVGIPVDYYLPKQRYHELESGNVHVWLESLYPSLNFDIVIAPLRQTAFSEGKSNIKWQEATRLGAAFVASNVGPYRSLEPSTARLTANTTDDWYHNLKQVLDSDFRKNQVLNAQYELLTKWRMEDNWPKYQQLFEQVKATA